MASMTIWCPCKVDELGKVKLDLYSPSLAGGLLEELLAGTARCKHCGELMKGQPKAIQRGKNGH